MTPGPETPTLMTASASPLLGTTLNDQNPSLTNIVLARQDITRTDGTPVKAQFTGSDNPMPLKLDGTAIYDSQDEGNAVDGGRSLQEENFQNVDVLAGRYMFNIDTIYCAMVFTIIIYSEEK